MNSSSPGTTTAHPLPGQESGAAGRLHWIDTVRILLTVLVVAHHCGVTYGNIPIWFYTEPARDPSGAALDVLVIINQLFFMGLFFFISGYLCPARSTARVQAPSPVIG